MYNLKTVSNAPSYGALLRNGFTDEQVIKYYNMTSSFNRQTYFKQVQMGLVEEVKAIVDVIKVGTQKCTVSEVRAMALDFMEEDFMVNGELYNMIDCGWKFSLNNNKTRFGLCVYKGKRDFFGGIIWQSKKLHLSQWLIKEVDKTFDEWKNTMLHEIAHAIDVEIRNKSGHDAHWRNIALAIGCDGERCFDAEVDPRSGKYTISCPNGHEQVGHKSSRRILNGKISCGKCSKEAGTKGFNRAYLLTQTQNY